MHEIIFLQTADAFNYKPILEATSRTVVEFCRRHDHGYESFIGIKRGAYAWHAAFNRIPMLQELLDRGFAGWAIYLDADAFVFDLDFDLRRYLEDKRDRSAVMVHMGVGPQWAINSGVVFINLGHPLGRAIVEGWSRKFAALSEDELGALSEWRDEMSDQSMLFEVLNESKAIQDSIYYESPSLMNRDHSKFIRQILRAYYPDLASRVAAIRTTTAEVIGASDGNATKDVYPILIQALYRVVLRRDPDAEGLAASIRHLDDVGIQTGMGNILASMLGSPEYAAKNRAASG